MKNQFIAFRVGKDLFIKIEMLRLKKAIFSGQITWDEAYQCVLYKWENQSKN